VIVLVTPFPAAGKLLESIKSAVDGKGKVFLDATNPFFSGNGLPKDSKHNSAVELHQSILGDKSAHWGVAYKTILWTKIIPGNSADTAVCGDDTARKVICDLVRAHGFVPVDKGGLSNAPGLEPGRK